MTGPSLSTERVIVPNYGCIFMETSLKNTIHHLEFSTSNVLEHLPVTVDLDSLREEAPPFHPLISDR